MNTIIKGLLKVVASQVIFYGLFMAVEYVETRKVKKEMERETRIREAKEKVNNGEAIIIEFID